MSHANLAFQIDGLLGADLVSEEDRVLLPLPLHHVYPFVMGMLTPLAAGLPIALPQSLMGPELVRALREGERPPSSSAYRGSTARSTPGSKRE